MKKYFLPLIVILFLVVAWLSAGRIGNMTGSSNGVIIIPLIVLLSWLSTYYFCGVNSKWYYTTTYFIVILVVFGFLIRNYFTYVRGEFVVQNQTYFQSHFLYPMLIYIVIGFATILFDILNTKQKTSKMRFVIYCVFMVLLTLSFIFVNIINTIAGSGWV